MIKSGKCQCVRQNKFPELLQLQNMNSKRFIERAWRELRTSLFHMTLLNVPPSGPLASPPYSLEDLRPLYPSISVQGV